MDVSKYFLNKCSYFFYGVTVSSATDAIHKLWKYPIDEENYPVNLFGATDIATLQKGPPRHFYEKLLGERSPLKYKVTRNTTSNLYTMQKLGESKVLEKVTKRTVREKVCETTVVENIILQKESGFECSYCKIRKATKVAMKAHINRDHLLSEPLKCEHCTFKSFNTDSMQQHRKICLNEKIFCPTCSFQTKRKAILKRHMRTHAERLFKCLNCNKKYYQKWILDRHMKSCNKKK